MRIDENSTCRASVSKIGDVANAAVQTHLHGTVYATFDRSMYVLLDGLHVQQLVCVGLPSIGDGPINVLVDTNETSLCAALSLDSPMTVGTPVDIKHGVLFIGSSCELYLSAESVVFDSRVTTVLASSSNFLLSQHVQSPECWAPQSALVLNAQNANPGQTLNPSFLQRALIKTTAPAVDALKAWLAECLLLNKVSDCPPQVAPLLGSGPGLTPSGDDFLAGVLIALHVLGRTELKNTLWRCLNAERILRTHVISNQFLVLAQAGKANAHISTCIKLILQGHDVQSHLFTQALSSVGSSSGWDTFYGIAVVLTQMHESQISLCQGQNDASMAVLE